MQQFFGNITNKRVLWCLDKSGVIVEDMPALRSSHVLAGKTFVFTGTLSDFTRAKAKEVVEVRGGRVMSNVSRNTGYFVAGVHPGSKFVAAILGSFMGLDLTHAATMTFFSSDQVATLVTEGPTWDKISSNGYYFTYTRDKFFNGGGGGPPTGRRNANIIRERGPARKTALQSRKRYYSVPHANALVATLVKLKKTDRPSKKTHHALYTIGSARIL